MLFQNILKTLIISRTEIFVTSQAEVFSSEFFVLVVMEGGGGGGRVGSPNSGPISGPDSRPHPKFRYILGIVS